MACACAVTATVGGDAMARVSELRLSFTGLSPAERASKARDAAGFASAVAKPRRFFTL
jgi:hypothetical protein